MNCKPGQLAVIIREPLAGRMVEVLYTAPAAEHRLPNRNISVPSPPNCWVVKAAGSPFVVVMRLGAQRKRAVSDYAVIPDAYLRPLPGNLEENEQDDEREKETA